MATVNYQSSCSLKKQSTETSQQMSRRILLYFYAREGLVDDGLCPKGNIVCVALEEPALCHTEKQASLGIVEVIVVLPDPFGPAMTMSTGRCLSVSMLKQSFQIHVSVVRRNVPLHPLSSASPPLQPRASVARASRRLAPPCLSVCTYRCS